jgi:hypothetical protein
MGQANQKPLDVLYYTDTEGGQWQKWPDDLVITKQLLMDCVSTKHVRVSEIRLGEFKFHSIILKNGRRWDTINGFTGYMTQSNLEFISFLA